jgi:hypothetical protein
MQSIEIDCSYAEGSTTSLRLVSSHLRVFEASQACWVLARAPQNHLGILSRKLNEIHNDAIAENVDTTHLAFFPLRKL